MIDTLPIFPLKGVLLFPGTYLPLHIFEPRYRSLVNYCIENDDEIGITSYFNKTEIQPIFGWGKIVKKEFLRDGKSNIVIQGMGIAKIIRFKVHEPFIIANVEKKLNDLSYLKSDEFHIILDEIIDLAIKHFMNLEVDKDFLDDIDKIREHNFPLDILASFLDLDPSNKLDILINENPFDKAKLLMFYLNKLLKENNS
jgi:ATP-dependent Lon protease